MIDNIMPVMQMATVTATPDIANFFIRTYFLYCIYGFDDIKAIGIFDKTIEVKALFAEIPRANSHIPVGK